MIVLDSLALPGRLHRELAVGAAALLRHTARLGLTLGDGVCPALALLRDLPAIIADRAWATLDLGIPIEVVR